MNKKEEAALMPHGYLLSEQGHEQLERLRDELLLTAYMVTAVTQEEEDQPLQIKRSLLGQWFESFGFRVDEVLSLLEWIRRSGSPPKQRP
jgi:DNA-binding PadR family transcriptional regulator